MKIKYDKVKDNPNAKQKRVIIYDASGNARSTFLAMDIKEERIFNLSPMNRYCYEVLLSSILTDPAISREFYMRLAMKGNSKPDCTAEFFIKKSAKIFTDLITTLILVAEERGEKPFFGLWEVINICLDPETLAKVLNTYPHIGKEHKHLLSDSGQSQGILGTLSEVLDPLSPLANAYKQSRDEGRIYDLNDFLNSNHILILTRDDERGGNALNTMYGLIINTVITKIIGQNAVDGRTKPASTFIIADEFQNLGFLEALLIVAQEGGRYGVCLMLATQSYGRVEDIWGKNKAQALIGNITHLISLKVADSGTAEFMSKLFGDTTVERITPVDGHDGTTFSQQLVNKPLFSSGEFLNLSKLSKVAKTPLEAIAKCDGKLFKVAFPWKDLHTMLPPEASNALKAQDTAPQDRAIFFPNPLEDDDFVRLGLGHLVELVDDEEE